MLLQECGSPVWFRVYGRCDGCTRLHAFPRSNQQAAAALLQSHWPKTEFKTDPARPIGGCRPDPELKASASVVKLACQTPMRWAARAVSRHHRRPRLRFRTLCSWTLNDKGRADARRRPVAGQHTGGACALADECTTGVFFAIGKHATYHPDSKTGLRLTHRRQPPGRTPT